MRRLLIPSIIGLVMLCAVCGAGAGAFWALSNPSGGPSIHNIPIYPAAANVSVQDLNTFASSNGVTFVGISSYGTSSSQTSSGGFQTGGISSAGDDGFITFSANDSPQQVYAFYDASLTRAGWTITYAGGLPTTAPPLVVAPTSGPRTYTYQSLLPWLPFLHKADAILTVSVQGSASAVGSDAIISLMHVP